MAGMDRALREMVPDFAPGFERGDDSDKVSSEPKLARHRPARPWQGGPGVLVHPLRPRRFST